ncbi:hypothetical protein SCA03_52480 [Streptomyces cacaoi]|uniref:Uncharacterized protein n=1 Tax=Streptomyces cacaoi TaxID=1898 RepID=A0A4Y3R7H8_STRCI|nr:hypothetical protein SCA03_52480 [Streptomyces cacaoi]
MWAAVGVRQVLLGGTGAEREQGFGFVGEVGHVVRGEVWRVYRLEQKSGAEGAVGRGGCRGQEAVGGEQ